MEKILANKIVLITGASSGIGEACVLQCAQKGAQIILAARRIDKLKKLSLHIKNEFQTESYVLALDVQDHISVEQGLQALPLGWKKIDILINNAGLALGLETLNDGNVKEWDTMIDTNVKGLLYVTKAVLPHMIKDNKGHIVNIGSLAGHEPYAKGAVYCATKHAVSALNEALRKELLGTDIRVSLISPGMVETELSKVRFKGDMLKAKKVYQGMMPLTANDIADSVLFCITRPPHVNINEIIILPTAQASATSVHRKS